MAQASVAQRLATLANRDGANRRRLASRYGTLLLHALHGLGAHRKPVALADQVGSRLYPAVKALPGSSRTLLLEHKTLRHAAEATSDASAFLTRRDQGGIERLRPPDPAERPLQDALLVRKSWYWTVNALGLPHTEIYDPSCGSSICVSGKAPKRMCAGCLIVRCAARAR